MTTVDHDMLIATLDRLKLTAIRDQLDTLLDKAARSKMNLREALAFLVSREIARRDERRISMSSKIAQFPFARELDNFDHAAQPSLNQEQIRELATCRWLAHRDALLFLGPPGTGKRRQRWQRFWPRLMPMACSISNPKARAGIPSSRHDGSFRHNADILHDGGVVTPDRGSRGRLDDIRALIDSYKRACCHLAWLKPEYRFYERLALPALRQTVTARLSLQDQWLTGPVHNGRHQRGGSLRACHDGRAGRAARSLLTRPAHIRYTRTALLDRQTILPALRPSVWFHDSSQSHNGAARYRWRRRFFHL